MMLVCLSNRARLSGFWARMGQGKTTTFYMMVGLERAEKGVIFLNERDVTSLPMYLRARLGLEYLPES